MRILLLTDEYRRHDSIGGGDVQAQQIAAGLGSRGHIIGICCTRGSLADLEPGDGAALFPVICPKATWKPCATFDFYRHVFADRRAIRRTLSRFRPDVIYCLHQRGLAVPTISFVNRLAMPLVYRMGDEWLRLHYYAEKYDVAKHWSVGLRRLVPRLAVSSVAWLADYKSGFFSRPDFSARFVICNSADLARRVSPFITGNCEVHLVRNGVDPNTFRFRSRRDRRPLRLLYVGRLVAHKGVHMLPEMMMHIRSSAHFRDVVLTIVGWSDDAAYIDHLRKAVASLGLCSAIRLCGVVSLGNMPSCYDEHDILVFPTPARPPKFTVEGCPSVLLEAMACGLPIVARMTPGVNEVVRHGETCVGVHEDTAEALARAVQRILTDQSLYERLAQSGRQQAEAKHSMARMLNETERVLLRAARSY